MYHASSQHPMLLSCAPIPGRSQTQRRRLWHVPVVRPASHATLVPAHLAPWLCQGHVASYAANLARQATMPCSARQQDSPCILILEVFERSPLPIPQHFLVGPHRAQHIVGCDMYIAIALHPARQLMAMMTYEVSWEAFEGYSGGQCMSSNANFSSRRLEWWTGRCSPV